MCVKSLLDLPEEPEIDLVSRDRGKEYVSAAASGAPQAMEWAIDHQDPHLTETCRFYFFIL